jgi:hypothetical protein
MHKYYVDYVNPSEGDDIQTFVCFAYDEDHANEQCLNAEPDATIMDTIIIQKDT